MVVTTYHSPLGEITLAADEQGLTGLWFEGQKHYGSTLAADAVEVRGSDAESGGAPVRIVDAGPGAVTGGTASDDASGAESAASVGRAGVDAVSVASSSPAACDDRAGSDAASAEVASLVAAASARSVEASADAATTVSADGSAADARVLPASRAVGPRAVGPRDAAALGVLERAWAWLNAYFAGQDPQFLPPLHLVGTSFQREVWAALVSVPRGETVTYGELAARVGKRRAVAHGVAAESVSPRAVGGAVARNPISIMLPCHRVVGASGDLTGYAGGVNRKRRLLEFEGVDVTQLA